MPGKPSGALYAGCCLTSGPINLEKQGLIRGCAYVSLAFTDQQMGMQTTSSGVKRLLILLCESGEMSPVHRDCTLRLGDLRLGDLMKWRWQVDSRINVNVLSPTDLDRYHGALKLSAHELPGRINT